MNLTIQEIQSISTIVIGLIVVYIAFQQHHTNKLRLRMDMYKQRYAVYKRVLEGLAEIKRKGDVERKDWVVFLEYFNESHFLFFKWSFQCWKSDIPGYLQELMDKCEKVDKINLDLREKYKKIGDAERKQMDDRKMELVNDLAELQSKKARNVFGGYLRMG